MVTTTTSRQRAHLSAFRFSVAPAAALAAPVFVIVAALVLALLALMPPYPSDQLHYFEFARSFPEVEPGSVVQHQHHRLGLVLPINLAILVFGYSQAAYYAVPILAGVTLAAAVYAIGTQLFSRAVGVAAALLTVGNSAIFVDLGVPLPDMPAAALFCAALALTIAVRQGRAFVVGTDRRRAATLLAIGALLGWSYLVREFIVFVWPLVPLLLVRRIAPRDFLWIGLPLVAIGIAEMAWNAVLFGDPLARLREASAHGSQPTREAIAITYRDKPVWWYLLRPAAAIGGLSEGVWLGAALAATVIGAVLSPRRLGTFLLWVALLYVPLVLLGGVLNPAMPMLRISKLRYWFAIMPALLIGGVAAVWLLASFVRQRVSRGAAWGGFLAAALVLVLAAVPVGIAHGARADDAAYRSNGATHMEQFRSWLSGQGGRVTTIWADNRTVSVARVFQADPFGSPIWHGTFQAMIASDPTARPQPGEHVLLYSAHSDLCGHCRLFAERVFGSPVAVPASWLLLFRTEDGIVEVYEAS